MPSRDSTLRAAVPSCDAATPLAGEVPPGLVYVTDAVPGISRRRSGKGFVYRMPDGKRLSDDVQLQRIRKLAIPPAYSDVWICTQERGHLQATGRDARGRKQYRYHARWRDARDSTKFERLLDFAAALPRIRMRVAADLQLPVGKQVQRASVLASIVRLLDATMLRIGNGEYARENGSFGLTTLRNRHVDVRGTRLRLRFRGKSGVLRDVGIEDARVARIVARCQTLPGQELFQYLDDDGQPHGIDSADVNAYLREISGGDFTAKDFRTWHGSVHALALVLGGAPVGTRSAAKAVLEVVACRLGNTVAVCRKAYVHPRVLTLLLEGAPDPLTPLPRVLRKSGLTVDERRFVTFLSGSSG